MPAIHDKLLSPAIRVQLPTLPVNPRQLRKELGRTYSREQVYARGVREAYTSVSTTMEPFVAADALCLYEILPQRLLELERPVAALMTMDVPDAPNPILSPHVDVRRKCGLNVYLECADDTTEFYSWNRDKFELHKTSEFVAVVGDCWLMDTTVPHAVRLAPKSLRSLLTFSFVETPYTVVKSLLENHRRTEQSPKLDLPGAPNV